MAARAAVRTARRGSACPIGHIEVRHRRRPLLRGGLAGADVEPAIDLARIRADHLDRERAEAHRGVSGWPRRADHDR